MRRVMVALVLFGALVAVLWFIVIVAGSHHDPQTLGLGSAFEGNLQLSASKIQAIFDGARDNMRAENRHGTWMQLGAVVLAVVSFLLSSVITVIVVFRRGSAKQDNASASAAAADAKPQAPAVEDVAASGLSKRTASWIAAFAAAASICGGAGNSLLAASQVRFKHADEIHDLVVRARKQVIDAGSAEAAQDVLDDLQLRSAR